jgi:hypothetical protein
MVGYITKLTKEKKSNIYIYTHTHKGMKLVSQPSSRVLEFEKNVSKPKPTIEFRNLKNQTQT